MSDKPKKHRFYRNLRRNTEEIFKLVLLVLEILKRVLDFFD
jgi:hypothetical protein